MTADVQRTSTPTGARRGRPRSAERHDAILRTTRALLASGGYDDLTMEAIAAGAGVSKPTLYKWWPEKAAVVTEAVIAGYVEMPAAPLEDTGDVARDLRAWLDLLFGQAADPSSSALVRAMISATAGTGDRDRMFTLLAEPTRQVLLRRLDAAVAQGQVRAGADPSAAADAIISIVMLEALTVRPPDLRNRVDGLLDLLLHGLVNQEVRS